MDEPVSVRNMRRLALASVALALLVVVLGAYTRLADAGLGCPDWPGCYGQLGAPQTPEALQAANALYPDAPVEVEKAWIEMVHRYFATLLGVCILVMAILALRAKGAAPRALPLCLLALVALQGAFGAWTVTLKLWPQMVTAHLLGGFATLALLWLLALRLGAGRRILRSAEASRPLAAASASPPPRWRRLDRLAALALAVVILQVALGGWVTSNYAALACPDFPTCHGAWAPPMDFRQGFDVLQAVGPNYLGGKLDSDARVAIQFTHRLGAVAVLVVVGLLCWRLLAAKHFLGPWVAALLAAQLGLGILNVLLALPLWVATAHNAGGAALLLSLVTVRHCGVQEPARE